MRMRINSFKNSMQSLVVLITCSDCALWLWTSYKIILKDQDFIYSRSYIGWRRSFPSQSSITNFIAESQSEILLIFIPIRNMSLNFI